MVEFDFAQALAMVHQYWFTRAFDSGGENIFNQPLCTDLNKAAASEYSGKLDDQNSDSTVTGLFWSTV